MSFLCNHLCNTSLWVGNTYLYPFHSYTKTNLFWGKQPPTTLQTHSKFSPSSSASPFTIQPPQLCTPIHNTVPQSSAPSFTTQFPTALHPYSKYSPPQLCSPIYNTVPPKALHLHSQYSPPQLCTLIHNTSPHNSATPFTLKLTTTVPLHSHILLGKTPESRIHSRFGWRVGAAKVNLSSEFVGLPIILATNHLFTWKVNSSLPPSKVTVCPALCLMLSWLSLSAVTIKGQEPAHKWQHCGSPDGTVTRSVPWWWLL